MYSGSLLDFDGVLHSNYAMIISLFTMDYSGGDYDSCDTVLTQGVNSASKSSGHSWVILCQFGEIREESLETLIWSLVLKWTSAFFLYLKFQHSNFHNFLPNGNIQ